MSLSEENKNKMFKFLDEKIPDMGACPLCKKKQWSVSDTVWQLPEFLKEGLMVGGTIFPVISITCNNCGNTYFLNAVVAGIVKSEKKGGKDE